MEQLQSSLWVTLAGGGVAGTRPTPDVGTGGLLLFFSPGGMASFWFPADSSFPLCCPGLHGDSLRTSFGDSMTAGGRGMPGMTHSLAPGEAGKVWLSGSPGSVWGRRSCLEESLWLTFLHPFFGIQDFYYAL